MLCIALTMQWQTYQLDVNNVFLYGVLDIPIYRHQPASYVDATHPSHICQLKKALYSLKQVPRAWYSTLNNFLLGYGFS